MIYSPNVFEYIQKETKVESGGNQDSIENLEKLHGLHCRSLVHRVFPMILSNLF